MACFLAESAAETPAVNHPAVAKAPVAVVVADVSLRVVATTPVVATTDAVADVSLRVDATTDAAATTVVVADVNHRVVARALADVVADVSHRAVAKAAVVRAVVVDFAAA